MKLNLIQPAREYSRRVSKKALAPPINLALIAALTPADVEVSITDENIAVIDFNQDVDLVGITTLTVTAHHAYEIADRFRAKGVKVVLGGIHTSIMPEEAGIHADAIVIGEAEEIWPALIDDFKANKLKHVYKQNGQPVLVNLPIPRRDLLDRSKYIAKNTIFTTRGCPFDCAFCSVTTFFGRNYRCRPIEEILKDLETLPKNEIVLFVDDNIAGNPKFAKELFRALIPRKIKWLSQCSVTIAKDDELLRLAAESGCVDLLIGFESISPASLASVGKKINKVEEYEDIIKKIHSYGIAIHGFFIFGFDADNEDVFKRTSDFARRMKLESAQFDLLTPYPGTKFHEGINKEGRLLTMDWSKYGYELVFKPKLIPAKTLQEKQIEVWRDFYSLPSIFKRIGLRHPNLLKFWFVNLYYRSHWRNKRLKTTSIVYGDEQSFDLAT
ncbi:MAG: radical SAM protein [Chloroflexi bacterium]|nr:radical SAM protein [Chloroflexota bacterium]